MSVGLLSRLVRTVLDGGDITPISYAEDREISNSSLTDLQLIATVEAQGEHIDSIRLRQRIREIHQDCKLSGDEKRHKTQEAMTHGRSPYQSAIPICLPSFPPTCRISPAAGEPGEPIEVTDDTNTMTTSTYCMQCSSNSNSAGFLVKGSSGATGRSESNHVHLTCLTAGVQPHACSLDATSNGESSPSYSSSMSECKHYVKACSRFHFACCNTIDNCHRCHMERTGCEKRPPEIASIVCDVCNMRQSPGASCQNRACPSAISNTPFSRRFCATCLVWTDSDITHCNKCATCRVGQPEDLYHCDTCDACFLTKQKHRHRCLKSSLKDQRCPLCLESVHFSQKRCDILHCGHVAHFDCLVTYLTHQSSKHTAPTCPTCRKCLLTPTAATPYWETMRDAIRRQPLPADWCPPIREGDEVLTLAGQRFLVKSFLRKPVSEISLSTATASLEMPLGRIVCYGLLVDSGLFTSFPVDALKKLYNVDILCNDCEKKCNTSFHYLGLECGSCHGFNTQRI